MKYRIFDILFSSLAILLFLPIFLIIPIILSFTGEGKVFYRQKRIGLFQKSFDLLKFATMLENSPNLPGGDITSSEDPRVLPFGKVLRKTKINELPQLFNILKGELSIVGPRPLTQKNFLFYNDSVRQIISSVKPGLSGLGSVIFRNEESLFKNLNCDVSQFYQEIISPYKGELEVWYVNHRSLRLYFKIIFITVVVVFLGYSNIVWKLFRNAPKPPSELSKLI
jgi:lipopolysaccharide/colanic/teichoic acid biosynthesis glycosyltransferase